VKKPKTPTNQRDSRQPSIFKNPQEAALNMGLVGITSLFVALTAAYLFSAPDWSWKQFSFPKLFLVSTLMIVASSWTLHKAVQAFNNDDEKSLKKMLTFTVILALGFVVTQFLGWGELRSEGIFVAGKPDGSYLYLISGLHALHVIGGIIPLGYYYFTTLKKLKDPVKSLLFITDENYKRKFDLLERYWHFVDILWIYLLFFFLFNHL